MKSYFPKKESKVVEFIKKRGFTIVVALCIISISIVGYVSISNVLLTPNVDDWEKLADGNTSDILSSVAPAVIPQENIKKDNKEDTTKSSSQSSSSSQNEKQAIASVPVKYSLPLVGEIVKNYSVDIPVFSKTLNDYRAHTGVDIAGKMLDPVKSAADGKVINLYSDELKGVVIEIQDRDGLVSTYCGLTDFSFVKKDQTVKAGDIIGKLGTQSSFESKDGVHLHFEVSKNGVYINPIDMLK